MGRAPCCDKANVKKGPWSPEEDVKLKSYIEQHGTGGNWIALPQKIGLKRCGKSCRLRWLNYLRPNIKHGGFSEEEERIICSLYITIGSRWSIIAAQLSGRTDNDIKNYWNTRLKKKLLGKPRKEQHHSRRVNGLKQEKKRATVRGNSVVDDGNYHVYMPVELPNVMEPIPYSYQEPINCKDHNSIRKLLIKLQGRFAVDNHQFLREGKTNLQFPVHEFTSTSQNILDQPAFMLSRDHELGESYQFNISNGIGNDRGMEMLQGGLGESSRTTGQAENYMPTPLPYNDNLQSMDGLEFLYEDHHDHEMMMMMMADSGSVVNNAIGNWGEVSSLICPPPPPLLSSSNYEIGLLQGLSSSTTTATTDQECSFTDLIIS